MSGNHTNIHFWHSDTNNNKGHLLVMTNQYVKYEDFVINNFQNNKGETILTFKAPVTFDLVT
jgi:hypothetical protein